MRGYEGVIEFRLGCLRGSFECVYRCAQVSMHMQCLIGRQGPCCQHDVHASARPQLRAQELRNSDLSSADRAPRGCQGSSSVSASRCHCFAHIHGFNTALDGPGPCRPHDICACGKISC